MAETLGKSNALRYRGYVYDPETALYYLQSRYYNPGTGRFINADVFISTGQGLLGNNMFAYCNNNPVILIDICGLVPKESVDSDGDGSYDYYVYEYTFVVVYTIGDMQWTESYTAEVYIFVGVNRSYFDNKDNIPKGFDKGIDLLVADITEIDEEGNINIVFYAYQVNKNHFASMPGALDCLLQYDTDFERNWGRTKSSLITEGVWHMALGGALGVAASANIDFDTQEEGKGGLYFTKKALKRIIGK